MSDSEAGGSERKDAHLDDALSHIRWAREANTDGKTVKTNRHLNRATELIERHLDTDSDPAEANPDA